MASKTIATILTLKDQFSDTLNKAAGNSKKFKRELKNVQNQTVSLKNDFMSVFNGIETKLGGFAVGAGLAKATKDAMNYKQELAKISTIVDTNKYSMDGLSKQIRKLSDDTGTNINTITDAVYEGISSGVDMADIMDVANVAVKSAKGGFTDAKTALDGLTSVTNAFGLASKDATGLANQFLITQNLGKTTFAELAPVVGRVAPTFKAAGLASQDMFAALSSLTANGIETSESVTGLKAVLSNIIKPSSEAEKMAKKLGLQFNVNALASKGLAGFLADVKAKTGGNTEKMAELFGSVEALNSVLVLTSENGGGLMNQALEQMKTNTTALDDAYKKMNNTPLSSWEKLSNIFKNISIDIGDALLPKFEEFTSKIGKADIQNVVFKISDTLQFTLDHMNEIIGTVITLKAMTTTWSIVETIQKVAGLMAAWKKATEGMTTAQVLLNLVMSANPIGIVITAIAGLTAGFIYFWNTSDQFRNFWIGLWEGIKSAVSATVDWIKEDWTRIIDFIINPVGTIINLLYDKNEGFRNWANSVIDTIKAPFLGIGEWWTNNVSSKLTLNPMKWFGGGDSNTTSIPAFATGTSYFSGGLAQVNERGGELAVHRDGTAIIPADKTQQLLKGNGLGSNININLNIQGNVIGNEEYAHYIGKTVVKELTLAIGNR